MIDNTGQLEEVKILIVGTAWCSVRDKLRVTKMSHHFLELEVPLLGSSAIFDTEEKAKNIYEEIPIELLQFKVEYFWQSNFHWQSDTIKQLLNEYGKPVKN